MSIGSTVDLATQRLVAPVEGMHQAIAGRWFGMLGAAGEPIRVAHDTVAGVVYGSIKLAGTAIGSGLDAWVAPQPTGGVQSFVNGLWGDALDRHEHRIGFSMAVCDASGASVPIGPDLASAFPDATSHIVVLVHGLIESDANWRNTAPETDLGQRIDAAANLTAVALRYNSGLRISDNGERLSQLLSDLDAAWPVPVESIALVGHSMGGLVIRSACHAAASADLSWLAKVRDVVTMGTPHQGAPLEKLANLTAWALGVAPETRPLADFINGRSAGIKDLRFGAIAEDDWDGENPDALLRNLVAEHSLPPDIRHHFVAGVVTSDPDHPIGAVVGDLMVRTASGTARDRLDPTNAEVLGGLRHADLRHDPRVIQHVIDWIAP